MMKRYLALVFLILMIAFAYGRSDIGNDLVLRYKGADMPVCIRGNLESKVFIIYLHGGPGGSSFIDIQNGFFAEIEQDYALVYYDQRASGNSIGKSHDSLLTLEQFVEDLDVVVHFTQTTFKPAKLVLMGHSWGATLGIAYLLDSAKQSKISGWIEIDGGHNLGPGAYEYSKAYVSSIADSMLRMQPNSKRWLKMKEFYQENHSWRYPEAIIQHSKNVKAVGGYFYDAGNVKGLVSLRQILFSETDFMALLAQNYQVIEKMDVWHYDFTPRLSELRLPKLLLWGEHDGILPVALAKEAAYEMGLKESQFYIFQESGHSPHYEETGLFNEKVTTFIRDYVE